jgi:hypothetical protein
MVRRSRSARKRQQSNVLLGSLALLVVLGILGGVGWWWSQRKPGVDPKTLCPVSGPIGHNVLLVDKTDPLNLAQKAAFDLWVTDLVERKTPKGYLLTIFVLGDDFKSQTLPLVELCNPGDATGHSELTENIKQLNRLYKDRFLQPVFDQSKELLGVTPAKESPILEMLQMVNLNAFLKHRVDGPKQLFVMSDLLQNSKSLSMYKGVPNFEDFSQTAYARKTKIDMTDVDVRVELLLNVPSLQKDNLLQFWESYFKQSGAMGFKVVQLPG